MTSRREVLEAAAVVSAVGSSVVPADIRETESVVSEGWSRSELPRVTVAVEVALPPEIREVARARYELGRRRSELPDDTPFEEYLLEHVQFEFEFSGCGSLREGCSGGGNH